MSLGEVDTLNLLTEKLDNLFNESQEYYETFLDANNLYKQDKLTDKEFFQKLGDYVVAYSALEFLSIKVMVGGGMGMQQGPRSGTAQNPVGAPPSIIGEGFSNPGTLPSPDPSIVPRQSNIAKCTSCGSDLRPNAKFCTSCGSKT